MRGYETVQKLERRAAVALGVGERFFVSVESTGQEDTRLVKAVARTLDLKGLAALYGLAPALLWCVPFVQRGLRDLFFGLTGQGWPTDPWQGLEKLILMLMEHTSAVPTKGGGHTVKRLALGAGG